jgi:phage-related protein (TIGR01555 family)
MQDNNRKVLREDTFVNAITGLNMKGDDKSTGARCIRQNISKEDKVILYSYNEIFGRMIDLPIQDALATGYKVVAFMNSKEVDLTNEFTNYLDDRSFEQAFNNALVWARLFGGGVNLLGVNDGQDHSEPVELDGIKDIEFIRDYDRYFFQTPIHDEIETDPSKENFCKPNFYKIVLNSISKNNSINVQSPQIHYSRVLRLETELTPFQELRRNGFWSTSFTDKVFQAVSKYQTSHDSISNLLNDFSFLILDYEDVPEMSMTSDDSIQDYFNRRIQTMHRMLSNQRLAITSKSESLRRETVNFGNVDRVLELVNNRLVTASGIPHTLLLGDSPSGLGATGESEKNSYLKMVSRLQNSVMLPQMRKLFSYVFAAKNGPTSGKVPDGFRIEFNPLEPEDMMHEANYKKVIAETDQIYINLGVDTPDEVAKSRFQNGSYSAETKIDMSKRD